MLRTRYAIALATIAVIAAAGGWSAAARAQQGRLHEAERDYDAALAIAQRQLDPAHYGNAVLLRGKADVVTKLGRSGEAEGLLKRIAEIRARALDE